MIYKFIYWLVLAILGAAAWGIVIAMLFNLLSGLAEFIGLI